MKLVQKLPRHKSNSGQICSTCLHAVSNHNIEIETSNPIIPAKLHSCNKCKSRKCAW